MMIKYSITTSKGIIWLIPMLQCRKRLFYFLRKMFFIYYYKSYNELWILKIVYGPKILSNTAFHEALVRIKIDFIGPINSYKPKNDT